MQRLLEATHAFSRVLAWMGGALLIGCAFLVTFEVFARKFFNYSLAGADELTGYAFCAATALAFSFALFERAHIRIDFIYRLLPRPMRALADIIGLLLLLGFALLVTAMILPMISDTWKFGSRSITPLRTPLIYPQSVWFFGWIFFCVSAAMLLIASLVAMVRADWPRVSRLIGIKSLEEQVADEAPEAAARKSKS